jgi:hypothetical protein
MVGRPGEGEGSPGDRPMDVLDEADAVGKDVAGESAGGSDLFMSAHVAASSRR